MRYLALLLLVAACQRDETLTSYGAEGTWRLTHVNDQTTEIPATISFAADGQVQGKAPCNSYSALQTAPYPWFALTPIAATKRACPDLALEQDFLTALAKMTLSEVSGDILILSNDADERLQFIRQHDG